MTIDEIYKNTDISVRSYNLCRYNNLNSLEKLLKYYNKHKSFKNLRNCGRKSNEELIEVCEKYLIISYKNEGENIEEIPIEELLSKLTRIQREVINSFILVNTNSLSVRSKNAISQFLDDNFSVRNFVEKILLDKGFKVVSIDNVGQKSIPELEIYISIVNEFIVNVSELSDERQLITLKNNFLIQRTFSISKIPSEILQSESIFQLTDFLLKNNAFYTQSHSLIIQKALKIYQKEKEHTLEEISLESNLSKERVRQIRKDCIDELFDKISFIKNFNDDLFQNYGIDKSSSLIEVNENLVKQVNTINKTNFSKEFVSYILSVYLSGDFIIIGNIEDVILPKFVNSRNRHNWNNFYIVNKKLSEVDFITLTNDINARIKERVEETYFFNFKSYLSKFMNNPDIELVELSFPIAEKIIYDEFGLHLDLDDNIVFKRNTIKQAFEYSYEALDKLGKPSKVEEITQKIFELHPNYKTDVKKVSASMKRKDGFVPVGRTSIFGLKKWENEVEDFKGGTIRSIANEYLMNSDEPKHISDLTQYILKYRPTSNEKSIYYNLRIDESQSFIFFKNSYIGLKKKKYPDNFKILTKSDLIEQMSWEDRYNLLVLFLSKENRLPLSINVPEEEVKLYRWMNVQKRKITLGKLDEEKTHLITEIFEKYSKINGRRLSNSDEKYNELISFLKLEHRLPSANKPGEENLYSFFYNQRKLNNKNELNDKETIKYYSILEIIKNFNL
ncbi:hypothetical protein [Elizabethkingia ursingii]|uniref:RNA polymerase sigma-70 region 4 domain-containing protein n=1 Tax=Elizabethkingia ursingii TaxID=1756150 RepID=A0AAJ3N9S1_9FLAO|nr:hypothetical protein [Elizabethkingia ursingii]AQX08396.1 hypothetical protein BBD34_06945 [Elizabethkingia ursingii]OPB72138.1 hypothetical protein BAY32_13415 [Elizabethkingia ursingii]